MLKNNRKSGKHYRFSIWSPLARMMAFRRPMNESNAARIWAGGKMLPNCWLERIDTLVIFCANHGLRNAPGRDVQRVCIRSTRQKFCRNIEVWDVVFQTFLANTCFMRRCWVLLQCIAPTTEIFAFPGLKYTFQNIFKINCCIFLNTMVQNGQHGGSIHYERWCLLSGGHPKVWIFARAEFLLASKHDHFVCWNTGRLRMMPHQRKRYFTTVHLRASQATFSFFPCKLYSVLVLDRALSETSRALAHFAACTASVILIC